MVSPAVKKFQMFKLLRQYRNYDPLDPTMTAQENAKRYFDKYNKQKRTYEAVTEQLAQTKTEIDHLESISTSMDIARLEEDLVQIKEELTEYGYIKRHYTGGKR